jgi:hypothetical protein
MRPGVDHSAYATDGDKDTVEKVMSSVLQFEQGIGTEWRDRCNRRYRQYRGVRDYQDAWVKAGPNDRDGLLREGKRTWGASLHIPLSYRTIETMVPAAISQRPRMLYLPRKERFADNVQNVRVLLDAQQDQIDIDLPFQAVMRSGRIYGLGVGKSFWRKEYGKRRRAQERTFVGQIVGQKFNRAYKLGEIEYVCTFDDPDFEDVDVQDFMWDPFGSDIRSCGWLVHRTWPSIEHCVQRIMSGAWNTATTREMVRKGDLVDQLRRVASGAKYDEVWQERNEASGFSSMRAGSAHGEPRLECLEWHDGDQVLTVLGRSIIVQEAENQCVGTKPFQAYRPTPLQKQMVGIGDLEPLEHLQRELDTLRSQRRDAATIALCAGYAYDDNSIDEDDLVFGPGAAIRVTNAGRVSDALMPIPVRDVPGSGYQEEQVIRQDFDAVAGVNDALDPRAGGTAGTATEAQLVQASLSRRIELGSRRFEIEIVRAAARCWLHLNQRMILKPKEYTVPEEGLTIAQAEESGRWRQFQLGPAELAGDFTIKVEGGSMAARNVPQDRQDAQMLMTMFGQHPNVDPRRPLERALKLMGVDDVQGWLKQDAPPVPPMALQLLEQAGVAPELIRFAVSQAQRQQPQLGGGEEQGPDVAMMNQAMGAAA